MIFQHTWEKVLSGEKTETTRWWDGFPYKLGRSYAVQPGRGRKSVGRIVIDGIRYCLVSGQLPYYKEEGFESQEAFWAALRKIHPGLSLGSHICVYHFHLEEEAK